MVCHTAGSQSLLTSFPKRGSLPILGLKTTVQVHKVIYFLITINIFFFQLLTVWLGLSRFGWYQSTHFVWF